MEIVNHFSSPFIPNFFVLFLLVTNHLSTLKRKKDFVRIETVTGLEDYVFNNEQTPPATNQQLATMKSTQLKAPNKLLSKLLSRKSPSCEGAELNMLPTYDLDEVNRLDAFRVQIRFVGEEEFAVFNFMRRSLQEAFYCYCECLLHRRLITRELVNEAATRKTHGT